MAAWTLAGRALKGSVVSVVPVAVVVVKAPAVVPAVGAVEVAVGVASELFGKVPALGSVAAVFGVTAGWAAPGWPATPIWVAVEGVWPGVAVRPWPGRALTDWPGVAPAAVVVRVPAGIPGTAVAGRVPAPPVWAEAAPAAAPPPAAPPAVCPEAVKVKISPQAPTNRRMLLCMWQQTPRGELQQSTRALKAHSGCARKVERKNSARALPARQRCEFRERPPGACAIVIQED